MPRSKEELKALEEKKLRDKVTMFRNCLKAGLTHVSNDIFADKDVYPTQYYRFGEPRKVSDIKQIISERNDGNIQSFAVQMHDFERVIPDEVLSVMINRRVEAIFKRRVKEEMSNIGLTTSIPENIYDPERDGELQSYSFDSEFSTDLPVSFFEEYYTQEDENGY